MKKIFFVFCLLLISNCLFPGKIKASILSSVLPKTQIIFSDSSYTQSTHNFSAGQTVYLRIENSGCGCTQKILRVLDNNKNEISQLTFDRAGASPYVFTASFSAPATEGIYYVDIKIEGSGSSYANQQNINVTGSVASVPTISPILTPKPTSAWKPTSTTIPTLFTNPTPTLAPRPSPLAPNVNFFQRFFEMLHQWLVSLTNRFQ